MADLTPMMQQYMATKEQYKDCILFYRLGDFYEMFFDDALVASKELEITLTGKNCGQEERAPMCGIPYHAADSYLTKLVNKGYKVAICEQVEDPKLAKGIVKREVIRIVTPGTNLNMMSLEESRNNYLMCIAYTEDKIGIAVVDALTGDFYVTEVSDTKKLNDEIVKFSPSEIICNDNFLVSGYSIDDLRERLGISINKIDAWHFEEDSCQKLLCKHFKVNTLTALGVDDFMAGQIAAGAVLAYLYETQKNSLSNITHLNPYIASKYMLLDSATRRNLELTETLREKQKKGSLLWVLDKTKTAMGARLLRTYLEQPLIEQADIVLRQEAVGELLAHPMSREELREYLSPIYDLERLLGKISYKTANPRDLIAFRNSLQMLPPIKTVLAEFETPLLQKLQEQIDELNIQIERSLKFDDLVEAHKERMEQEKLIKKHTQAMQRYEKKMEAKNNLVTEDEIAAVVAQWTKIPLKKLEEKESERLLKLEKILHKRVIGQTEAVEAVARAMRRGRVGLQDPKRPIGSFLFLGPTGVGKTELSKALAEAMFGSENDLIRVDMSEYMEPHSVAKMIGSPPGYVGHDDGGQLSEKIRRNPYSVVLFDEIEKAHPDVFNILLQVLDDGHITDSKGRKVSFKNAIIIMTSNAGASRIVDPKNLGFATKTTEQQDYQRMKNGVMEEVKRLFKPEFINRIDEIMVFHTLNKEEIRKIVTLLLKSLEERCMEQMDIRLNVTNSAVDYLAEAGFDAKYGARPLRRAIQSKIEDRLANELLEGKIKRGDQVQVQYRNKEIRFIVKDKKED